MAVAPDPSSETGIYCELFSRYMEILIKDIDIVQLMDDFEHKQAIQKEQFTKIYNETDSATKSKMFLEILLERDILEELQESYRLITRNKPGHYLVTALGAIQQKYAARMSTTSSTSHVAAVDASSIKNSEADKMEFLRREKENLEDDLDTARKDIEKKNQVIRKLEQERDALQVQLTGARTRLTEMQQEISELTNANSELEKQLKDLKTIIKQLQIQLVSNGIERDSMKADIRELKDNLTLVKDKLLSGYEKMFEMGQHSKKSKVCLLM